MLKEMIVQVIKIRTVIAVRDKPFSHGSLQIINRNVSEWCLVKMTKIEFLPRVIKSDLMDNNNTA
jgi:hypothetical protein